MLTGPDGMPTTPININPFFRLNTSPSINGGSTTTSINPLLRAKSCTFPLAGPTTDKLLAIKLGQAMGIIRT
jgi:hypothetical protein